MSLTKTSKHKEQALKLMQVVTSDEVQTLSVSTTAHVTPLKNPQVRSQIGSKMPFLQGKHLQGIFKGKMAPAPRVSDYESAVGGIVASAFTDYMDGKDLNTALREAEEAMNGKIAELKSK